MVAEDGQDVQQSEHQEPVFKHYCRVCKRGFGCAGALGGHMRSHGVGDVRWRRTGHHQSGSHSHGDDKETFVNIGNFRSKASQGEITKHAYFLRTNTNNRFTSYNRSTISEDVNQKRPDQDESAEFEEATSMMMINKSKRAKSHNLFEDHHHQHCAINNSSEEEEDLANCLVMLSSNRRSSFVASDVEENKHDHVDVVKGLFQCKACKKVFNSHQALGGHRASHKKVKGCSYASRFNNDDDETTIEEDFINQSQSGEELTVDHQSQNSSEPGGTIHLDFSPHHQLIPNTNSTIILSNKKSKAHQCSICQRVFSSGQALGGHKRCHWLTSNLPDNTIIQNLQHFNVFDSQQRLYKKPMLPPPSSSPAPPLDLNFPPMLKNNVAGGCYSTADLFDYKAPARMFLQLWGNNEEDQADKRRDHHHHQQPVVHDDSKNSTSEEDDHGRIKKIAKLSDLKDSDDGGPSRWLQVGINASTKQV